MRRAHWTIEHINASVHSCAWSSALCPSSQIATDTAEAAAWVMAALGIPRDAHRVAQLMQQGRLHSCAAVQHLGAQLHLCTVPAQGQAASKPRQQRGRLPACATGTTDSLALHMLITGAIAGLARPQRTMHSQMAARFAGSHIATDLLAAQQPQVARAYTAPCSS